MTTGILSQVGRVVEVGKGSGVIFDQSTATAFPGSSGGGIFLADGENKSEYIAMLVRGAGEGFNLIVPIRRIKQWATDVNLLWIINPSVAPPTMKEILKIKVESDESGISVSNKADENQPTPAQTKFPFLITK